MAFTEPAFFGFAAAALILYYAVPKRAQWFVLLAASLLFYSSGGPEMLPFLLLTTGVTYGGSLALEHVGSARRGTSGGHGARRRKALVFLVCAVNFGLLFYLKYWSYIFSLITGGEAVRQPLLPLGISFYMFQSVGYVVDIYRSKYPAEKNPFKYLLFVSFFPQIVQGPISRHNQLNPQLIRERRLSFDDLKCGIQLSMWGYFKKSVIADRAAILVGAVFSKSDLAGSVIALGVLFYCVQLYCDFSGGIDIARGTARMFGIDLADNFRRPIFAVSLSDYWRRWHITLGAWMRDYVFYPIALSKPLARLGKLCRRHIRGPAGKIIPTSVATFAVYLLIGVWHGAGFKYIAYGLWNGIIITGSLLCEPLFVKLRAGLGCGNSPAWRAVFILRTCTLVFLGRYLTRASSLLSALTLIRTTFSDFNARALIDGSVFALGLAPFDFLVVLAGAALIVVVEFFQERGVGIRVWLETRCFALQWVAAAGALVVLLFLAVLRQDYIASAFIYQGY